MRTRLHLKPGQRGTKLLLAQYGDRFVCVRYRCDAQRRKRLKTVELIVAEHDWDPPAPRLADDAPVAVRVDFAELDQRQRVKQLVESALPTARCGSCGMPTSSRSRQKPGSWTSRHLILDAVTNPKGIYMQMRRRPLHVDACIQYRILASGPRCSGLRPNYSYADHSEEAVTL